MDYRAFGDSKMTFKHIWQTVTTHALLVAILLGTGSANLPGWAQSLTVTDETEETETEGSDTPATEASNATFLDWLNGFDANPDADEPPLTKRGGSEFCLVAFDLEATTPVWSDRPDFVIQGDERRFALYTEDSDEPLWTSDPNEAESVAYTGPELESGITYTLRAENPRNPDNDFQARRFTLLSSAEQNEIAAALLELETAMQASGQSEDAIALARADYFWQRGLTVDAWAEVIPLQNTSEATAEAIATAYERICE